jgi:hypothetical protein
LPALPCWRHVATEQVVSPEVLKRIQADSNSFQFDDVFANGAMFKHGDLGQGIYVDPGHDVVGVYFSTNGCIAPYGEDKMRGFIRRAAIMLAGDWPDLDRIDRI